jgi:anti-anti-sigma factor
MVPEQPGFSLDVQPWEDGGTRVVASGELDLAVAAEFRETLAEQLAAGPVLLDLRELWFMDSSGVAALDALLRTAAKQGRSLQLGATLQQPVRRVLEMTGMLETLVIADAEETA